MKRHASLHGLSDGHEALRALWQRLDEGVSAPRQLGDRLEQHVRFEERLGFEPTRDRLPIEVRQAIGSDCAAIARRCPNELPQEMGA